MAGVWLGLGQKKTTPFVVCIWLRLGQKIEKTPFAVGLLLSLGNKKEEHTL